MKNIDLRVLVILIAGIAGSLLFFYRVLNGIGLIFQVRMKKGVKTVILTIVLISLLLVWAPWMDDQAIHDRVFQEKARKDGTMGWITHPDGTREYTIICDYNVMWFPFGRWVASCEGGYFVTFWGKII